MKHAEGFLKIVNDSKSRIRETTLHEIKQRIDSKDSFVLIDVRETSEWNQGHLPGAIHLSKGIIERDIEKTIPDLKIPLVLYCGGGYRSALAADNVQRMGYQNVLSMDGGFKGWKEAGYPLENV